MSITTKEAAQIWVAAMDHSQAVLAVDAATRQSEETGATEDDAKQLRAQMDLDNAVNNLRAHITDAVKESK